MPKQPPRFLFRTRAISDLALSDGAQRLYMLLDDEARGETSLHLKQLRLAVTLGISTRELQFRIGELEASKYLTIRRTIHGNRYEFVWKDTNAGSQADANHISPRMRTPVHMLPITQETTSTPLPPASGGIMCGACDDSPRRIMVSRDGREPVRMWCPACGGPKVRRIA